MKNQPIKFLRLIEEYIISFNPRFLLRTQIQTQRALDNWALGL